MTARESLVIYIYFTTDIIYMQLVVATYLGTYDCEALVLFHNI